MGDFSDGAVAVFGREEVDERLVVLYALNIIGRMADAVKVAAEADVVIVAHEVQHMVDMAVHAFYAGIVVIIFKELAGEGDTDKTVIFVDSLNLLVVEITRMWAESLGIGMRRNNWLGAGFDNIPEACRSDMGNIDKHTQLVHFCNNLTAKDGQAAAAFFFVDTVSDIVAVAPGERHSTHAKLIQAAQSLEAAVNSAALFNRQQRCCLVVEYVGNVLLRAYLQHVNAVSVQLFYLLKVLVEVLQCVVQTAVIAEFLRRNINSAELQTAAELYQALNIKMLVVGVDAGAFLV